MPSNIPKPARRIGTTSGRGVDSRDALGRPHRCLHRVRADPGAPGRLVRQQGDQLLGQPAEGRRIGPLVPQGGQLVGDQRVLDDAEIHSCTVASPARSRTGRRRPGPRARQTSDRPPKQPKIALSSSRGRATSPGGRRLQEGVAALGGLVGHVGQPGRLAGEHLLTDQAVVDGVEGELQHPLGGRALGADAPAPLQAGAFQLGVRDDPVDHAHPVRLLGGVGLTQEEDLAGELLADLPGQIGRPVAAVEGADVGVGLLEPGVLGAGQGEVADHVQAVSAAGRPPVDQRDHHLGHEPDQALHLQDVQPAERRRVDRVGVLAVGVVVAGRDRGSAGHRRCRMPSRRPWATGRCP